MKHALKRSMILTFCFVLCLAMPPTTEARAEGSFFETATHEMIRSKIQTIGNMIKGSYWNAGMSEAALKTAINKGEYTTGTTNKPCSSHAKDENGKYPYCTSNEFGRAWQCNGFARYMAYAVFGVDFSTSAPWTYYRGSNAQNVSFEPGDIIYFWPNTIGTDAHWIMVWYTDGDDLYIIDANHGGNCKIFMGKYTQGSTPITVSRVRNLIVSEKASLTKAACNQNGASLTEPIVTANKATNITMTSATITGNIYFPTNMRPTYWGIDVGTTESNLTNVPLTKSNAISSSASSGVSISVDFSTDVSASNNPLHADTTYYYRFWAKYNGNNYAHSSVQSFKTLSSPHTYTASDFTLTAIDDSKITETTAYVRATVKHYSSNTLKKCGLYLGTSQNSLSKVSSLTETISAGVLNQYNPLPIYYTVGSESSALTPNTTYYYKFWIEAADGSEAESGIGQFTTKPGTAPQTCTVTFNPCGGSGYQTKTIAEGSQIGTLPTPSLYAYNFTGWYTALFGGTKISASTTVSGDVTYYAHWSRANPIKITLDPNGGTLMGEILSMRLTGYDKSRGADELIVYKNVNPSTNIYGREVAVDTNGKIVAIRQYGGPTPLTVPSGGYVISGNGNTAGGGGVFMKAVLDNSCTHMSIDHATGLVTAYPDYASWAADTRYAASGGKYPSLPTPTWTNHRFDGWYTAASGGTRVTTDTTVSATASHTLYAHWTELFSLDLNGCINGENQNSLMDCGTVDVYINGTLVKSGVSDFQQYYPAGTSYEIKNIQAAKGYTYIGCVQGSLSGKTSAGWTGVRLSFGKNYTVTYNANGGTGAPDSQTKVHGVDLKLSSTKPTRSDAAAGYYTVTLNANGGSVNPASLTAAYTTKYTFKNWNTKAAGGGVTYNPGMNYTTNSSLGLYAQWEETTSAAAVTLPAPTRDGYTFKGWAENSSAAEGVTGSYTPTGNVTLYAIWSSNAPVTYRVDSTVKNGGADISHTTASAGTVITVSNLHPHDGYELESITCTSQGGGTTDITQDRTFVMPASDVMITIIFKSSAPQNLFTDVSNPSEYYYNAVYWARDKGITTGRTPTTFDPYAPCTRGQIVTFLWRMMGEPSPASSTNPFTDVKPGDYFYTAVLWAYHREITTGKTATTFLPYSPCTREQSVTFLWRAAGKPGSGGGNPFKDVKAGTYYYDAVRWAVAKGITTGRTGTVFGVGQTCTRAQIVTFLYRYAT